LACPIICSKLHHWRRIYLARHIDPESPFQDNLTGIVHTNPDNDTETVAFSWLLQWIDGEQLLQESASSDYFEVNVHGYWL
jgi:hypothetical protein